MFHSLTAANAAAFGLHRALESNAIVVWQNTCSRHHLLSLSLSTMVLSVVSQYPISNVKIEPRPTCHPTKQKNVKKNDDITCQPRVSPNRVRKDILTASCVNIILSYAISYYQVSPNHVRKNIFLNMQKRGSWFLSRCIIFFCRGYPASWYPKELVRGESPDFCDNVWLSC